MSLLPVSGAASPETESLDRGMDTLCRLAAALLSLVLDWIVN